MVSTHKKIGLVHHLDGGNLGEDAALAVIADRIATLWQGAEIVGLPLVWEDRVRPLTFPFSHKTPVDQAETSSTGVSLKDKVKALVVSAPFLLASLKAGYRLAKAPAEVVWEIGFLTKSFRAVRKLDALVVSVGDQLEEPNGKHRVFRYTRWKFSYSIFKWVALARIAGVYSVVMNVSTEDLRGMSRAFFRKALSLADSVSFRDETSKNHLPVSILSGKGHALPDTAYGYKLTLSDGNHQEHEKPVVGLAPMLLGDPSPEYERFLQSVTSFASELIKSGYSVTLFCTNIGVDSPACCGVQDRMNLRIGDTSGGLDRVHQWSSEELARNMVSMDYVVTSRYHGVLFAHLLNKPVLAISNQRSTRDLMTDLGLAEYFVDIDRSDSGAMMKAFQSLVSHRDEIKNHMSTTLRCYKDRLSTTLNQVLSTV